MSVLQVYLNWVNSVLSDVCDTPCPGVTAIQEGKVLCQLIDTLCPEADLLRKVQSAPDQSAHTYLRTALDHMHSHGIKFHFTPQDILDGDIKSILDVLWLIILNYAVHTISSSPYQRSVGIGKKLILDWCQKKLQIGFDPQNSLTVNLCSGDWFLKLLAKNSDTPLNKLIGKEENLQIQLTAIEHEYGIKHGLINPSDIVEGTVDEHTLMIYLSLLRLKIGNSVGEPLTSLNDLSYQSIKRPLAEQPELQHTSVSAIVTEDTPLDINTHFTASSAESCPLNTHPRRSSSEALSPESFDWMSQSTGSHISSIYNNQQSPIPDAESLLKLTISQNVEEMITHQENNMEQEDSQKSQGSRIPVRVRHSEECHRSAISPGRLEDDSKEKDIRKVSLKVQRPRSPNSIMAETRERQEKEKQRKKSETEDQDRQIKDDIDRDEHAMTGSASEGGDISDGRARVKYNFETDPVKSDEDDQVKYKSSVSFPMRQQINGDIDGEVPVFVMPGQKHDVELLLEALQHARTEANVQDQLTQSIPTDQPNFRQVVDKNIEQLEAQLAAVKAQSKELFEDSVRKQDADASRGRAPYREQHRSHRGEERSPARGILDMMVNQNIHAENTTPKERFFEDERGTPLSILKNRVRSPSDLARTYTAEHRGRDVLHSPDRKRSLSPYSNGTDGEMDPDKRLIRFLTNEIENMKLKMAVIEQKSQQRSQSPYGMGPRVIGCLPERDRSPGQISTRARVRYADSISDVNIRCFSPRYSPTRRARSTEFIYDVMSQSPKFDSPTRSSSRSPERSPVSMLRLRTPENIAGEISHSLSPSARVLSLQDLSTSINDDLDGNLTFSPASGARPVNLGYSSPIRKVNEEIWGYGQTEDDFYADTAKYESWKKLISQDIITDEDNLELKQALASALVELNILLAKLKNANSDIKFKMGKTSEVLNDCRAQISKSQAENAELRSQIEREKSKAEAQELQIKEMEHTMHSAKSNEDDKTLELEESVITLKGIVNLDKNQMGHLEEENEKLRKMMSEFQRENIKLKEDFNELKIYNDKAQQTIKDLKSCLEDAKGERTQLITEIKKLKEQGMNNVVSSIVNHYMEKGLYEDAEKDHLLDRKRSRSVSPNGFRRACNTSPLSRTLTMESRSYSTSERSPVKSSSPLQGIESNYAKSSFISNSRSQTPTSGSFKYEDISPAFMSDGHEIYPHRRTKSYVKKFGTQNDTLTPVDLNDSEIEELLKPKTTLNYDLDLNVTTENKDGPSAKRQLLYSPYMDKIPRIQQLEDDNLTQESFVTGYKPKSAADRKSSVDEKIENAKFMIALDSAVKQTAAQLAQQRFLRGLDISTTADDCRERWRNPSKGILKNAKSAQNMSIKEGIPTHWSLESRSISPSERSPVLRSYTPDILPSRRGNLTPLSRSYPGHTVQDNSCSPYNRNRSVKGGVPTFVSVNWSYSPDQYQIHQARDSGYNTPTQHNGRFQSFVTNNNRDNIQHRIPTRLHAASKKTAELLSEQERRYADLLIDKYTRPQFVGMPLASS